MSKQYFTRPNVQPVITYIGTTPEQRQMSTEEFKAKFDEMTVNLQNYIKETLLTELDAFKGDFLEHIDKYLALKTNFETHQAESVAKTIRIIEPYNQLTKTTVNVGFRPKLVIVEVAIKDTKYASTGYVTNETQSVKYVVAYSGSYATVSGRAVNLYFDSNNLIQGTATITQTGLEINWTATGTIDASGNRHLIITAITHGG